MVAYLKFQYLNYVRQHRYLREILVVVIFHIFFLGFLYENGSDESIWMVFSVYAILLNIVTAPSLFFWEKGNTIYFLLGKPRGRRQFFRSKVVFIVLVDLFWVFLFALIYGLRFISPHYFLLLPLHLLILTLQLLLTTLLISIGFSYRPGYSWLIILFVILGSIVNKAAILPIENVAESYKVLIFLLPPLLEFIFFNISFSLSFPQSIFPVIGILQIILLYKLSLRAMMRKDFV